jgi:benzoate-CoA ligase family protein
MAVLHLQHKRFSYAQSEKRMPGQPSAKDRIFTPDWHAFQDPAVPDWINPLELLLGRHIADPAKAEKIALIIDDENVSYRALDARVRTVAGGLRDFGLRPEQRLLMFGTDSFDYVTIWLGALHAGLVPAVVSDLYRPKDLLYLLEDTGACCLFIDSEQIGKLDEIAEYLPESLERILVRGAAGGIAAKLGGRHVRELSSFAGAKSFPGTIRHANDICYMFYSGGTTGQAKGITHLTHDFLLVPERHGPFWEYTSQDVVFATSKKYFTHGLWPGVLIPLYYGATAVLTRAAVHPQMVLDLLIRENVTKLITVPTILRNVLDHIDSKSDFIRPATLNFVASASEKIPPHLFNRFHSVFGVEIFDSIGSSEVTYEWIANRPKDFKRGSLGRPVFGYEVKLMDHEGREILEPDIPGEAWIRSKTSCFFYWRKYDKSREAIVGEWIRSGDNLYFDTEGYFWFAGRENDVFKVSGLWVSPLDIEAALMLHTAVVEAAVVPFVGDGGLIKPKAFVVLKNGHAPSAKLEQELREKVRPLGGYKVPAAFDYIENLPRTTLQKVDRKALRAWDETASANTP